MNGLLHRGSGRMIGAPACGEIMDYVVLTPQTPGYPKKLKRRLGADAPTLYARGRLDFLSQWTMAFFTADVEPGSSRAQYGTCSFPFLNSG